jgi:hypothetical protein
VARGEGTKKLTTWEYRGGWINTSNNAGMGVGREEFKTKRGTSLGTILSRVRAEEKRRKKKN